MARNAFVATRHGSASCFFHGLHESYLISWNGLLCQKAEPLMRHNIYVGIVPGILTIF
jgi:hypothetical protein